MNHPSKLFSVFLTPKSEDYNSLSKVIKTLSVKYGTSHFEPHVTVYSGVYSDSIQLKRIFKKSLPAIQPFSLQIKGINASPNYSKTLYIEFYYNELLENIYKTLKTAIPDLSNYILMPHLSLMYKETTEVERSYLLRESIILSSHIFFDELKIVSPSNLKEGWKDTSNWEIIFKKKLGV